MHQILKTKCISMHSSRLKKASVSTNFTVEVFYPNNSSRVICAHGVKSSATLSIRPAVVTKKKRDSKAVPRVNEGGEERGKRREDVRREHPPLPFELSLIIASFMSLMEFLFLLSLPKRARFYLPSNGAPYFSLPKLSHSVNTTNLY